MNTNYARCKIFLLTRLLRGVTPGVGEAEFCIVISTHTPLARRDALVVLREVESNYFYSHASCEA